MLKLEKVNDKEQRKSIVKEIKAYDKGRTAISCGVDMDENFRRLKYVRYADDFLCAVIGTKAEAETLRDMIEEHVKYTDSPKGREVLENFDRYLPNFKKIIPNDYKRMMRLSAKLEEKGMSPEQAQIEAFYESTRH